MPTPPHRFEAGTPAIVQAIGLGAAIDYVESVGRERIKAHEDALLDYAMQRLGELNWLRIFGRAKHKGCDHLLRRWRAPTRTT